VFDEIRETGILVIMKAILCSVFLLTIFVIGATSLKCYICSSVVNPEGCGDGADVDPKFIKDCDDSDKDVRMMNPPHQPDLEHLPENGDQRGV